MSESDPQTVEPGRSSPPRPARRFRPTALVAEMHYQLRTEGGTPRGNAISVGLGTLIGCLPLFGFHFPLCVVFARLLDANRLKTYLAANISNPLVAPFLLYFELGVGHWIFEGRWPSLRLEELKAAGAWALGRDVIAGSLVVGVVLAVVLGALAFHVARRWQRAPFDERLREATSRRYRECGISHWEFVRGKLRYDPMYRAILDSEILPREGRLLDIGCGRGILLALVDTARHLEEDAISPPLGWRPPGERLELQGFELRPRLAAVARQAMGDGATIEAADAASAALPPARAILLLDVLHYLEAAEQEELVDRVAGALEGGGVLVLREADAALGWRFALTRAAERLCALGRGHWRQRFHYRSAAGWRRLLERHGLAVEERPMWAGTPYANRLVEARKGPTR